MTEPVHLHHYPVSPFAEKARLMLGFKRLAWKSVQIPLIMPKPDVVALTGGYRRTPILQVGADIYCDTALIARVLERVAPAPSFFPQGDTYAVQAAAQFADSTLFWNTVPVGFQPGMGMMKIFFKDAAPEYLAAFGKDRSAYRGATRRGPAHECKANLAGLLAQDRGAACRAVPLRRRALLCRFLALPRALAALAAGRPAADARALSAHARVHGAHDRDRPRQIQPRSRAATRSRSRNPRSPSR